MLEGGLCLLSYKVAKGRNSDSSHHFMMVTIRHYKEAADCYDIAYIWKPNLAEPRITFLDNVIASIKEIVQEL